MILTQCVPTPYSCRLKLATLYVQLGQSDDALTLLETEPGSEEAAGYHHSDMTLAEFDPRSEMEMRDKSLQVSTVYTSLPSMEISGLDSYVLDAFVRC